MDKETDYFLSNECMSAIRELSLKYPNDMDFGKQIRSFIQNTKGSYKLHTKSTFNQPDMGDVDEN